MSEINAQKNATESEAKNFYEWLESNKAGYDNFMSSVFTDSPFPQGIADDVVTKFKIVNRALKDTIYHGHALMFSAAILWEKVKPTLTPEQIEQFKQADLKMVDAVTIFGKLAGVVGEDEAKRKMSDIANRSEQSCIRSREEAMREQKQAAPTDAAHNVAEAPALDPKDFSV